MKKGFITTLACIALMSVASVSHAAKRTFQLKSTNDNVFRIDKNIALYSLQYMTYTTTDIHLIIAGRMLEHLQLDGSPQEYARTKLELRKKAEDLCAKSRNIDICTVYFWVDASKTPSQEYELSPEIIKANSAGHYYINNIEGSTNFVWK